MEPLNMPPGFRFHPTDEELVMHYLMPKVKGHELQFDLIREVDLYKFEPWDLPDKSLLKGSESEWYFFSARFKKYPRGSRKNRCTECGFWKATGKDRPVKCLSKNVAMKKTLVFHEGRASHGRRTDWLMYEYRLENDALNRVPQDAVVLCRISKKIRPGLHDAAAEMSPIIQGVDDLPLTRGCNLTDELSHVFPLESASNSTLLAGYSKLINAKQKHQLEIQDPKTNLGSISAIVDTLDRMNYEPAITLLLESSDQSPGNASKIVDQPELENSSFGRDEELIQELYDFLMGENVSEDKTAVKLEPFNNFDSSDEFACWQHQPLLNEDALEVGMIEELLQLIQQPTPAAEIESMLDASYVQPTQPTGLEGNLEDSCSESVDEAFAGDRWQSAESIFSELEAGDALDLLQGQSCHLETDLPLSNSPYFAVEYPTQFARPHRSFPRKLDSEVTFGIPLGAPFTHTPLSTQRSCPTIESSSQPTKASKSSPLSMFAELLDSISVPPALAAEVQQNPKDFMPVMTVFSMIQQADLSSVSVCKLRNPCKNRRSIDRRACGSFSFVVLLGAFSAMFWFLLLRLAWGFACSLNKVFFYDSKLH